MGRTLRKVCSVTQLSLQFHYTQRSGTVDYVGIGIGMLFLFMFLGLFCFVYVKANLMAHCSRTFRDGMR